MNRDYAARKFKLLLLEPRNIWMGQNVALGYLVSSLKARGIEVAALSQANHREYPPDHLERLMLERHKPDLIGISLYYCGYFQTRDMVDRIKSHYSCPVVVGGPQMNIEGAHILHDIPGLDFAIVGEAEHSLPNLCKALQEGTDLCDVKGLIWRRNDGGIVQNDPQPEEQDLDSLPFPSYREFGIERIRDYTLMSSRGCPFSCSYCFRSSRRWRARSPENMIEELDYAQREYGSTSFTIVDDSFNLNQRRIIRFCKLLKQNNVNMRWGATGGRLDKMTDELLQAMSEAGCERISVGIETLQEDVFAKIDKSETLEQIKEGVSKLLKYGITVSGNFIIGLPGDTPEKTWDTYNKAKTLGLDGTFWTMLLPFPKTKVHEEIFGRADVKILADYRDVSGYWFYTPKHSIVRSCFELPEYPEKEKIRMFHRVWVREGLPKPLYHRSFLVLGLRATFLILRYDPLHFPFRMWKMVKHVWTRMSRSWSGKPYYQELVYRNDFLPSIDTLADRFGNSTVPMDD